MKTIIQKTFLYISSFIPLYFLIIVKEIIEILNGNLSFNITNSVMLTLNLLLIIIGVIGVTILYKKSYQKTEIVKIRNITREDFLPYFPLFVLFALAFELEYISMAVVYLLILIMLGVVYVKNDMYYINPFLNIVGFKTYEVECCDTAGRIFKRKIFSQKDNFKFVNEVFGK